MNVHLTFDVEVWCKGWARLDETFPSAFDRYIYGRSAAGDWALPKTLEILARHGLRAVFFVEPLFSARFGASYLERIVRLIRGAGQDVQLHLHPEWTDEIRPALIADSSRKRQHLSYYTLDEQTRLIGHAKQLLEATGSGPMTAFRAGSYAANRDTFEALRRNGIWIDSSPNRWYAVSTPELRATHDLRSPFVIDGVSVFPVTVFRDGFWRERPAQINGASFEELRGALDSACAAGHQNFVIVSHSFEMLKPNRSVPDPVVVRRFERLCAYLEAHRDQMPLCSYVPIPSPPNAALHPQVAHAATWATSVRYAEQLVRRWY